MCAAKKGAKKKLRRPQSCLLLVPCWLFQLCLRWKLFYYRYLGSLGNLWCQKRFILQFSQAFRFCKANNFVMQSLIWKSLSYESRSNQLWHATARLYVNGEGRRKKESTVPSLQNFFSFFASEKAFCTIRLNPNLLPSSFRHLSSLQPSF